MNPIYVTGGRQKKSETFKSSAEWERFGSAVIVKIDPTSLECTQMVEYISPPEARPDENPSVVFKAGTLEGDKLYVCTQTEVLVYNVHDFSLAHYISLPCFNDLHHVRPTERGTLLVAVTGLDMVMELTVAGDVINEWGVLGQDPWERFDRTVDYRKVATTKPHASHPNYVFEYSGEVWASRFEQRDTACVSSPGKSIYIGQERPHDGVVLGDKVYFTTVDGHVAILNLNSLAVEALHDLNSIANLDAPLGWTRGLKILDEHRLVIGASTLRVTSIRNNIRWVKKKFGQLEEDKVVPTNIALYNVAEGCVEWVKVLDDPMVDVVFSVL